MAWVKIPKEHHPLFMASLPKTPKSIVKPMFGGLCAMVNGKMACGLFAKTAIVRLGDKELKTVLAMDGAQIFDPMGRGAMKDVAMLPEDVFGDPAELRGWLQKALDHTATMKPKAKAKKPAKKLKH